MLPLTLKSRPNATAANGGAKNRKGQGLPTAWYTKYKEGIIFQNGSLTVTKPPETMQAIKGSLGSFKEASEV